MIKPNSTEKTAPTTIQFIPKKVEFTNNRGIRFYIYLKAGITIAISKFSREKPLSGSETKIIEQIHLLRFNEKKRYVTTGGHFYQLFARNLGIFYNALLDPRISINEPDWLNRQKIALKTIALDLAVFQKAGREYTTIVPVFKNLYTCLNLYARPSDSLFAILYTVNALSDNTFIEKIYPGYIKTKRSLQSKDACANLLKTYRTTLDRLITAYYKEVVDENTGLVRYNLSLSSARDGIRRNSSFYDNVIAYTTIKMARDLNLYLISNSELMNWKKRILLAFWDKDKKIFYDDLSPESKKNKNFSSDCLVILGTQFLDIQNPDDRTYFKNIVRYVKKEKLDLPFPIHYAKNDISEKLYTPVRVFAPSYMGTSIWSHWGMEYIKTLIYLTKENPSYLTDVKRHLDSYKKQITFYGGYPEVYDKNGLLLNQNMYSSVLHNGWVINYEQTKLLLDCIIQP